MSRYMYALPLLIALFVALTLPSATLARDQDAPVAAKLQMGDPAPALKVEKFVKGEPVTAFKPGHVYVVEFWATWCGPCKLTMPHLTELQKKFQGKATFIGVNIWEEHQKPYTEQTLVKVEDFVKNNAEKMGYTVAFDGGAKEMDKAYMKASGQDGIPCAFIVTPDAKIAYIGDPRNAEFESTIQKLVDGKFDMKVAIAEAKERRASDEEFRSDYPKFVKLLNAKQYDQAYAVATKLVEGSAKNNAEYLNMIAWLLVDPEAGIETPNADLALKAAERAVKLSESKEPAVLDTLARCYWLKGDKAKAIETQTKAVELCKNQPEMQESLQKTLDEYKK